MKKLIVVIMLSVATTLLAANNLNYTRLSNVRVLESTQSGTHIFSRELGDFWVHGEIPGYTGGRIADLFVKPGADYYGTTTIGTGIKMKGYDLLKGDELTDAWANEALIARREADAREGERQREAERLRKIYEDQREKDRMLALQYEANKEETDRRVLDFLKSNATNGLPNAQFELGMAYLGDKNSGITNRTLAEYWLIKSALQDNKSAVDQLKRMKPNAWEVILSLAKKDQ